MQLEPARSQSIIMNRVLWGHQLRLKVIRQREDSTEQRGQLVHARRLLQHFFYVFNRYGEVPKFSMEYHELDDLIMAGWRVD